MKLTAGYDNYMFLSNGKFVPEIQVKYFIVSLASNSAGNILLTGIYFLSKKYISI